MPESPSLDIFNQTEALENVGGSAELLLDLSQTLIEELPKLLSAAQQAITSGNAASASRSLHSIKGSVTPFAAKTSYDIAWEMEQAAAAGDLNGASDRLADLELELERLVAAMKSANL